MNHAPSRKKGRPANYPRKVTCGRASVTVYRRQAPGGQTCYRGVRYVDKRRFLDHYPSEDLALEAANPLARQLSTWQVVAAATANAQASEYAAADCRKDASGVSTADAQAWLDGFKAAPQTVKKLPHRPVYPFRACRGPGLCP